MKDDLRDAFYELNTALRETRIRRMMPDLRQRLSEIGVFYKPRVLPPEQLEQYMPEGIGVVDGSMNAFGGAEPNIVHALYAMYLPDLVRPPIERAKVICPIIPSMRELSPASGLAVLEAETALEGLRTFGSRALLLDGGCIRFIAEAEEIFDELLSEVRHRGTLLMGIIEDIKSRSVGEALGIDAYDREILFGALDEGEAFLIGRPHNLKSPSGIATAYYRPGKNPLPVAMDYPIFLRDRAQEALDLVMSLTSRDGRGIPLVLDVVDRRTRIDNREMEAYMKAVLDEDLRRIFLDETRKMRWL